VLALRASQQSASASTSPPPLRNECTSRTKQAAPSGLA
jgi:hypothetical protein